MAEVEGSQIRDYEILVSGALLEKWGKSAEYVPKRVERARNIVLEADQLLDPNQKVGVARNIKSFLDLNRERLIADLGEEHVAKFESLISEIINSKGQAGAGFVDLHRLAISGLNERGVLAEDAEALSDTEMIIAQLKADILNLLKGQVGDKKELRALRKERDISDAFDDLGDALRGQASFESTMQAMLDLLMKKLRLEGAAILYNIPLKEGVEFDENKFPKGEIGEEKIVTKGQVDLNRVRAELSKHDSAEPTFVGIDVDGNPKTYCVMPVQLRRMQLGTIVLIADGERKDVEAAHKNMVKFVESRVDTLIDAGMKNLLQRRFREEINRISESAGTSKLPEAFKQYLTLLRQFVSADIEFVWRDMMSIHGFRVTETEVIDLLPDELGSIIDSDEKGSRLIRMFDTRRPFFPDESEEEESPLCVGVLTLDNSGEITEEEEELTLIAAELLKHDVLERKALFEAYSFGVGTNVAGNVIEGKAEWQGKHPCVYIMADIQSSTAFCETIGQEAYSRLLNQFYINLALMELAPNHRLILDKEIGDGVLLISTTVGKEGKEYGYNIAVGLHNIKKIRDAWERAMDTEKNLPWRPKLCLGIQSSDAAIRGFYGPRPTKRYVGRVDYTSAGPAVNEASRVLAAAKFGQNYVTKKTYDAYREFVEKSKRERTWDGSLEEFLQIGSDINVFGKGVADPIDVLEVLSEEEISAMKRDQERVFVEKKAEGSEYAFRSASEIPNGHYAIDYHVPDSKTSSRKVFLKLGNTELAALIPETEFRQITEYVPIDVHQKIISGELPDKIVRVTDNKVIVVYYKCVESRNRKIIEGLVDDSMDQKRGIRIDFEDLPSGDYIIDAYLKVEGGHKFELRGLGNSFIVFVPEKKLEGNPSKYGVLKYHSRKFTCIPEAEPEWAYMK